jgi:hypothetical protein
MSNVTLVRNLGKLVERHGAAQVSVWLGYRDSRAVSVWVATKRIPPPRIELVKSVVKKHYRN